MQSEQNKVLKIFRFERVIIPVIIGLGVVGYFSFKDFDPKPFFEIQPSFQLWFWLFMAFTMVVMRDVAYMYRIRLLTDKQLSWRNSFHVIMGLGFIMGGFCPGTSVVGAVIGKIDAMFFFFGMFIGIFLFGHFYDSFESIYLGHNLGNIFVFDSLGMSREWFAFMLILVALIAFLITQRIEDIVNDTPATVRQSRPSHFFPSFILIFSGLLLLLLPSQPRNSWYETDAKTILSEVANKNHYTDADEIAFSIMQGKNYPVLLVDVRDPESFQRFTLPGAINIPLNDIFDYNWESIFDNHNQKVVLFSYSETQASEAWLLLRRKGYKEMKVLEGGLNNFMNTIFIEEFIPERKRPDCIDMHTARFRTEAKEYFTTGKAIKKIESPQIPVIKIVEIEKPISGGC
jgi:rhodanese-related sulfurtransferase